MKSSRDGLETERLTVTQRMDEMDAMIEEQRKAMMLVDENIHLKVGKIDDKKVFFL